jgi:hypothetical protein
MPKKLVLGWSRLSRVIDDLVAIQSNRRFESCRGHHLKLRRRQYRDVCAGRTGRIGPILRVQSMQYEWLGGCGADENDPVIHRHRPMVRPGTIRVTKRPASDSARDLATEPGRQDARHCPPSLGSSPSGGAVPPVLAVRRANLSGRRISSTAHVSDGGCGSGDCSSAIVRLICIRQKELRFLSCQSIHSGMM